ncbi:ABC transporter ATP-binding protein [Lacrimispora sp.]|uniref:ABC transporter ATP-binding protein n=1 Tax=Lacrimispora sp. TaxID=2719234 RepID=UPI0032E4E46E
MNFIKRVKQFVLPFLGEFICAYIFIIIFCLTTLLKPKITNFILDNAIGRRNIENLQKYILLFCMIFIISELCRICQSIMLLIIGENMTLSLRKKIYIAATRNSLVDIRKVESGDIINRIVNEIPQIADYYTKTIPNFMTNIIALFTGIFMMLNLDLYSTIVTIIFLPLIYIVTKCFSPKIKKISKESTEKNAKFMSILEQILNNITIIKHNYDYSYIDKHAFGNMQDIKKNKYRLAKMNFIMTVLLTIITFIPNVFILLWGGIRCIEGKITIGTLVALNSYVGYLISPVIFFAQSAIGFQQNEIVVCRYENIIDSYHEEKKNKKKVTDFNSICFSHVDFGYEMNTMLQDLNFVINKGDIVQIVGRNGVGKTTIVNLLCGLIRPVKGEVCINDLSLVEIDLEGLISVVTQDYHFFDDSIKNNILLGKNFPDQKIKILAQELNFDDIINTEKLNLGSIIMGKGGNISGGQAQKINILRALVSDAPIIIFDEVDTFLDIESKKSVEKYILNHQEKTFILITHQNFIDINITKRINL